MKTKSHNINWFFTLFFILCAGNHELKGQAILSNGLPQNTPGMYWNLTPVFNVSKSNAWNTNTWFKGVMDSRECSHLQGGAIYEVERQIYIPGGVEANSASETMKLICHNVTNSQDTSNWYHGMSYFSVGPNVILQDCKPNYRGFKYTSGAITSNQEFLYGYFRIVLKVPKGRGFWPCFWLHGGGSPNTDPFGGEIDIFEMGGNLSDINQQFYSNIWNYDTSKINYGWQGYNGRDFSQYYDTISCHWSANKIDFYWNSHCYLSYTSNDIDIPNYYMHIIVDLAVDQFCKNDDSTHTWSNPPDGTLYIKEIKAWQESPQHPAPSLYVNKKSGESSYQTGSLPDGSTPALGQNFPNPFVGKTMINCLIPEGSANAELIITDILGHKLKSQVIKDRGAIQVPIDGESLRPGLYFYKLLVDYHQVETRRMVVLY